MSVIKIDIPINTNLQQYLIANIHLTEFSVVCLIY